MINPNASLIRAREEKHAFCGRWLRQRLLQAWINPSSDAKSWQNLAPNLNLNHLETSYNWPNFWFRELVRFQPLISRFKNLGFAVTVHHDELVIPHKLIYLIRGEINVDLRIKVGVLLPNCFVCFSLCFDVFGLFMCFCVLFYGLLCKMSRTFE